MCSFSTASRVAQYFDEVFETIMEYLTAMLFPTARAPQYKATQVSISENPDKIINQYV